MILFEGFANLAQEDAANDAAAPPHHGDAAVIQVPAVGPGGGTHQRIALGVGDDLRGVQGLADLLDKGHAIPLEHHFGAGELLGSRHALFLGSGQAAGKHRLADEGQGHAFVQRRDARPFAGALLAGGVQNHVHQRLAVLVLVGQNVPGDLDQIAVQFALVPFGENLAHFVRRHAQIIPHQLIGFANELHVAIFNAVVHHFDEVACAAFAHPVAAGFAVYLGADALENGLHIGPGFRGTAGHHAGALQSALLAAGDAGADIIQALAFYILAAADGIREMRIAAVDDDVALFQMGNQLLDEGIHRRAGLHHEHDLPGLFQIFHQFLDGIGADDVLALAAAFYKVGHLGGGAVEHGHGEALGFHVHYQVFTHDCQADEADICFFHAVYSLSQRFTRALPFHTLQTWSSSTGEA